MKPDLKTRYLGLELEHPLIAAASPLTATLDGMRRLEDAGAAAVVMASLYEEKVVAEDTAYALLTEYGSYCQPEATDYFPSLPQYRHGISGHLGTLSRAAEALDIPVIASINGVTPEGWVDYAQQVEEAGAAAIELNFFATPHLGRTGFEWEAELVDVVRAIRDCTSIPLAVKIAPHFSAIADIAARLAGAGADGLVLFNTAHNPDIDLNTLAVVYPIDPGNARVAQLWIALLSPYIGASFAASGGVSTHDEVIKYLLVGADAVMTASALLRRGPEYLGLLVDGLSRWMEVRRYDSIDAIRGLRDVSHFPDAEDLLRARHIAALRQYVPEQLS